MHGGQSERCASSASARSGGSDPSMYSPRSSTQAAQCSRGLANVFRPAGGWKYEATVTGPRGKDAPAWTPIRSFSEELAKLFAQCEPGPVQPALDGGYGQIEGVRDFLVGEPVHVLQQEHCSIVFGQAGDRLVDRAAQLTVHHLLVGALGPVAEGRRVQMAFRRESRSLELQR